MLQMDKILNEESSECVIRNRKSNHVKLSARMCKNSVHGSTKLTTNGIRAPRINYLTVRPELVEGFLRVFTQSGAATHLLRQVEAKLIFRRTRSRDIEGVDSFGIVSDFEIRISDLIFH